MKSAVIKTGGKQYLVSEGDKITIEKLDTEAGKKVSFGEVLLTVNDDKITLGTPLVKGGKVEGKVVSHGRRDKVVGVKTKAKKRFMKYFGHRQHSTEVEITKIA